MADDLVRKGVETLDAHYDEARPLVMKWAVVTVAIQDVLRSRGSLEVGWPDVARVATRWLEGRGNRTREWQTPEQALDRLSATLGGPAGVVSTLPPRPPASLGGVDGAVSVWMQRYGLGLLRVLLGVVFLWLGAMRAFNRSSTDDPLPGADALIPILGFCGMAIGLLLLYRATARLALPLLLLQIPATALPLMLSPERCFAHFPYVLTLEGQHIIESLMLAAAAIVVGGSVRHAGRRQEQAAS